MTVQGVNKPPASAAPVSLKTLFVAYLEIGLTAFGFTILQKLRVLVKSKAWLTDEEINAGLALVQLYPGPIMLDFTAYVGYKLRGVWGAFLAVLGFVLPSFLLMIGLSAFYFASGNIPWVHSLFLGLEALVVGILLNVAFDFGGRALKSPIEASLALAAFAGLLFKVNPVWIVLGTLALGALLLQPNGNTSKENKSDRTPPTPLSLRTWLPIGVAAAVVLAGVGAAWQLHSELGLMGLSFFKIGAVAFGNGTTILPLIQADIVDRYHWLNLSQFADGVALGQVTPGPFLITAAFVGYKMGGVAGAALATFAIFSPSFVMTLVFTEAFTRLRNLSVVQGALRGVLASFVGLLAVVVLQLGSIGVTGPVTLVLAGASFVATRYLKLDVVWVFVGGLALWGGLLALGLA